MDKEKLKIYTSIFLLLAGFVCFTALGIYSPVSTRADRTSMYSVAAGIFIFSPMVLFTGRIPTSTLSSSNGADPTQNRRKQYQSLRIAPSHLKHIRKPDNPNHVNSRVRLSITSFSRRWRIYTSSEPDDEDPA